MPTRPLARASQPNAQLKLTSVLPTLPPPISPLFLRIPAMRGGSPGWVRGRCLGRGSTAAVHLGAATSGAQESFFAVKSAEFSRSAPLQREQKILSSLRSPHVVSCLGSDVTEEPDGRVLYNLFLEYVPGGSLAEEIKLQGGLDEDTVRACTRGILDGLAYIHSRGIVHCDVKSNNILVAGEEGQSVKLADLGCARWVDGGSDDSVVISGTPLYMAPEVARGVEQGPAADIWALGCTVIEMATGFPPWRDVEDPVTAIHRIAFSGDVPEFPCNVSDDAKDFLCRCLSRDPSKRWSAEELLSHPFLNCGEESTAGCVPRRSPKSILDQEFWDSWQDEEEEDEDEAKSHMGNQPLDSAQGRLRQLVGGCVLPPLAAISPWEESCWITVRNGVAGSSSICLSTVPSTTCSASVESAADGGGNAESSGYSDCVVVTTEGHPPSIPCSQFLASADNVIRSCNMVSLDGGRDPFVYKQSTVYASLPIA